MRYKCSNCGNTTEYKPSFCGKCGYCVVESASISLSFDVNGSAIPLRVAYVNPMEIKVANLLAESIDGLDVEHRTDAYTTLAYKEINYARVQYIKENIYLQLMLSKEDKEKYIDDPMFAAANKKDAFWRTKYNEKLLQTYIEIIKNSIEYMKYLDSKRGK